MAITYLTDAVVKTLKLYFVNYPTYGNTFGDLIDRFYTDKAFAGDEKSGYNAAARDAKFVALSSALALPSLTVAAGNYREREIQFWENWLAKPPTAKP